MFLFGEQARRRASDEPLVITPQSVLERLREMGVRSGNGSRLVGRDAVYASFSRLRERGYIRRIVQSDEATGQRTGVAYEFYDWPAWNPDAPDLSTSPQVGATSGNAGSGNAGSSEKPQVGSTSGNAGSPPHPPEEEDSSSPNPLTDPKSVVPSPREPEFSPESIAAAEKFLQQMQQWQAGSATARRCAPRLLRSMRKQGWPALDGMDAEHLVLLEADILKNTGGAVSWTKCLPGWVDDLRLYAAVRPKAAQDGTSADGASTAVRAALVAACTACDRSGWVLDDDDDGPMRRCTHPGVTVQAGAGR